MPSLGVDIVGTFTDTILLSEGTVYAVKTPSTDDLISGVLQGVTDVCKSSGVSPEEIDILRHGSTVAVNALIEGTGSDSAIVATAVFEDDIEVGEGYRDDALLYDICGERDPPLIPRHRRYGVPERLGPNGEIEEKLDTDAVRGVVDGISAAGVEGVAVCLLYSYSNPEHERRVADVFAERAPEIDVSLSSDVSPKIREYFRMSTTAVDAHLKPEVESYLTRLENELGAAGVSAPLDVMKSDGGIARASIAKQRPVTQLISGPVAGIEAARFVGTQLGIEDMVTFDMGGTSCDTSLIEGGSPVEESHRSVGGMDVNGPFVNMENVGAGGGSIAWLTAVDELRVGPESAGANPGPVCYGRGGQQPTVTDADLVLGILNPSDFAGGQFDLNVATARESIRTHIADPLGVGVERAALMIRNVIDNKMAGAINVVSIEEGYDLRDFVLVGFGGAGPMHACNVARELGIETVVFPNKPGLFSALGMLTTDIKHEYVRSIVETVADIDRDELNDTLAQTLSRGNDELATERVDPTNRTFEVSVDLMYTGQSHSINVPVETVNDPGSAALSREDLASAADAFEQRHEANYGFTDEGNSIELLDLRVTAIGETRTPNIEPGGRTSKLDEARRDKREVQCDADTTVIAHCYEWNEIGGEQQIQGPAVIEMRNSTVWLPPAFDAEVTRNRHIVARSGGVNP